jgi:hypothetical protein
MAAVESAGPLGQQRGVWFVILIGILTIGFYWWYWIYKSFEELKGYRGRGVGGVLGLVIWIVVHPVDAFVLPSEIGDLYAEDGRPKPVSGWTGLWLFPFGFLIVPAIVWGVKVQRAMNRFWQSKERGGPASASPVPAQGDTPTPEQ